MSFQRLARQTIKASSVGYRTVYCTSNRYSVMPKRSISSSPEVEELKPIDLDSKVGLISSGKNKASRLWILVPLMKE